MRGIPTSRPYKLGGKYRPRENDVGGNLQTFFRRMCQAIPEPPLDWAPSFQFRGAALEHLCLGKASEDSALQNEYART